MNAATQAPGSQHDMSQRIKRLAAEDPQFRDSFSLPAVTSAKTQPGLRLAQVVQIVMEGYAHRPALGQRARELVTDSASGRKTLRLLPRFETVTYRDLWARARATASEWHHHEQHPLAAGGFTCILGFASVDYATLILANIHLGAVIVPLQTSAPTAQHAAIIAETQPTILGAGIEYLDAAVDAVLAGFVPQRLVVFDYEAQDDEQRDKLEAARRRLAKAGCAIVLDTLASLIGRAASLQLAPLYVPEASEDPLAWLFYTSGSTGTPKGAMMTQGLVINAWVSQVPIPAITLSFMPMSHVVGSGHMLMVLANGGMSYCAPKSDLSTLFEDLSLARPTMATLVPRVCELFHHHFLSEVDRRVAAGVDQATVEETVKLEMRQELLGGRLVSVGCGSASLSPETYAFMESMLGLHMSIGYSSTEIAGGTVLVDCKVQRPPVIAYKLDDVPELGYFNTDKPYPRGELLVKSDRFMAGYYKRPELTAECFDADGFYRTGDIMAEIGPDQLLYLDRRNNVVKLSQGEFVAVSRLEALYSHSPAVRQIYIYASSERAYLLAIVVPADELVERLRGDEKAAEDVKATIRRSLQEIADENHLNGYEIPRDFVLETVPFSLQNGLLSEIGKHQRPKLKERYSERLEQLYTQLAQDQFDELRALRTGGANRPAIETVTRAVRAVLGVAAGDVRADAHFGDLGGDSLSALELSTLLDEIFHVEVPVGVIMNPAADMRHLASYIETERNAGTKHPSFANVHADRAKVHASDLQLEAFIDKELLAKAPSLPRSADEIRTILLTGATGYLGRFMAVSWLERVAKTGGKLICIARGVDAAQARQRIESALGSDKALIAHFRALAAAHLEVLPGDLGLPNLGLSEDTWQRLAKTVDLVAHPGAHVNHVLPYNHLFAANVVGTAELIRLSITTRLKRVHYVSTLGVNILSPQLIDEDSDIRTAIPSCEIKRSYANGYNVSKWASEVLLREAFDLCALPVVVFRPGMILAHSRYAGQLNVPDMFTRLLFSLVTTSVAPATFYAEDTSGGRPRGRYDGLAVDFLADSIAAIGVRDTAGFHTYNISSPYDDGVSLDTIVDWLVEAGCGIERIEKYGEWLSRFETAMHALPEEQQQQSLLALLEPYRRPQAAGSKSLLSADRFRAACRAAGFDIPHLSAALIKKYVTDLQHLGILPKIHAG